MSQPLDEILDRCVDAVHSGRDPEGILRDHPEAADTVRPLVGIAGELEALPAPKPDTERMMRGLARILTQQGEPARKKRFFLLRTSFLVRAAAVLLAVLVVGAGAARVASPTVPGDWLYPVKRLAERIRYALAASPEGRAELLLTSSDERLEEALKKHQRGNGIDKVILHEMLRYAHRAFEAGPALPDVHRAIHIERVACACRVHRESLERLRKRVPAEDQRFLDECIQTCDERCQCLHALRQGSSEASWPPPAGTLRNWVDRFPEHPPEHSRQEDR